VVDGGHPTINTSLIRPRFWKKVAQHDNRDNPDNRGCTVLFVIHFPLNLRHTKKIKNINVWKRTEVGVMKKEGFGPRATLMKTKSSRAGAVLFLGLLHSQPANTVVLHEGST